MNAAEQTMQTFPAVADEDMILSAAMHHPAVWGQAFWDRAFHSEQTEALAAARIGVPAIIEAAGAIPDAAGLITVPRSASDEVALAGALAMFGPPETWVPDSSHYAGCEIACARGMWSHLENARARVEDERRAYEMEIEPW